MHQAKHEESASHDRTEIPSTSTYRRLEDASLITGPAFDRRFPRGSAATNIAAKRPPSTAENCRFQKSSALAPAEFRRSADEYGHGDVTSPLHGIAFRSIVLCTNRHFSEVACTKQQRLLRRSPSRACCRDPPVERRDGDAEARGHFPGRCSLVE